MSRSCEGHIEVISKSCQEVIPDQISAFCQTIGLAVGFSVSDLLVILIWWFIFVDYRLHWAKKFSVAFRGKNVEPLRFYKPLRSYKPLQPYEPFTTWKQIGFVSAYGKALTQFAGDDWILKSCICTERILVEQQLSPAYTCNHKVFQSL